MKKIFNQPVDFGFVLTVAAVLLLLFTLGSSWYSFKNPPQPPPQTTIIGYVVDYNDTHTDFYPVQHMTHTHIWNGIRFRTQTDNGGITEFYINIVNQNSWLFGAIKESRIKKLPLRIVGEYRDSGFIINNIYRNDGLEVYKNPYYYF